MHARKVIATADEFIMEHMADALHNIPRDNSKLMVLLGIHASLQQHMTASPDDQESTHKLRLSNELRAKIENLKCEAVLLRREGKVRDALQTMRVMKQVEHTLAIRPWQHSKPHERPADLPTQCVSGKRF